MNNSGPCCHLVPTLSQTSWIFVVSGLKDAMSVAKDLQEEKKGPIQAKVVSVLINRLHSIIAYLLDVLSFIYFSVIGMIFLIPLEFRMLAIWVYVYAFVCNCVFMCTGPFEGLQVDVGYILYCSPPL